MKVCKVKVRYLGSSIRKEVGMVFWVVLRTDSMATGLVYSSYGVSDATRRRQLAIPVRSGRLKHGWPLGNGGC